MSTNKLVNAKEAADWMGVSLVTFYKFRKDGMPYIKISRNCVRYDLGRMKDWLEQRSALMIAQDNKAR